MTEWSTSGLRLVRRNCLEGAATVLFFRSCRILYLASGIHYKPSASITIIGEWQHRIALGGSTMCRFIQLPHRQDLSRFIYSHCPPLGSLRFDFAQSEPRNMRNANNCSYGPGFATCSRTATSNEGSISGRRTPMAGVEAATLGCGEKTVVDSHLIPVPNSPPDPNQTNDEKELDPSRL
jgi:hypothetical protein